MRNIWLRISDMRDCGGLCHSDGTVNLVFMGALASEKGPDGEYIINDHLNLVSALTDLIASGHRDAAEEERSDW